MCKSVFFYDKVFADSVVHRTMTGDVPIVVCLRDKFCIQIDVEVEAGKACSR